MTPPDGDRPAVSGKPRAIAVFPGGGHRFQTIRLLEQLAPHLAIRCVGSVDRWSSKQTERLGVELSDYRPVRTMGQRSPLAVLCGFVASLRTARSAIAQVRPVIVFGVGSSMCLPLFVAARLAGIPSVFVESITRVEDISKTGRLLLATRLCTHFYVQWPELADPRRGILYAGTVL